MKRSISGISRLIPGARITGLLTAGLVILTVLSAHHAARERALATHDRATAREIQSNTMRARRQWQQMATSARAAAPIRPAGETRSITHTAPLALASIERSAVICDTPLSTITAMAQGTLYALNPARAAQKMAWAPGLTSMGFVVEGQWHTLGGLDCFVDALKRHPIALSSAHINATSFVFSVEVLGD
ncbi:MAG TPA: hypothetical protein VMV40_08510 [Acidiferrobacter sp.]|nr:hypothetical protein [Acidiferrobacter sp.]